MKIHLTMMALAAALALAACGGGGAGGEPVADDETAVPDSALSSSDGFTRWVGARQASDTREPLTMNAMDAPVSDTVEPIEVD